MQASTPDFPISIGVAPHEFLCFLLHNISTAALIGEDLSNAVCSDESTVIWGDVILFELGQDIELRWCPTQAHFHELK